MREAASAGLGKVGQSVPGKTHASGSDLYVHAGFCSYRKKVPFSCAYVAQALKDSVELQHITTIEAGNTSIRRSVRRAS